MSSKAASLASRLVESNNPSGRRKHSDDDEDLDEDAIFTELEAEIENDGDYHLREQALKVMKDEMLNLQQMRQDRHGNYSELTDEKQIIRATATEPRCVVHFYHTKFKRCEIMDKHLSALAPKYFGTRFLRVFVENVPFLVERLGIKVLPCVICFVDGVSKDRLIGFEQLGNSDSFDTALLELRLSTSGVIQKGRTANTGLNTVFKVSKGQAAAENDDEFDL